MKYDVKVSKSDCVWACVPTVLCAALALFVVVLETGPFDSLVRKTAACSISTPDHKVFRDHKFVWTPGRSKHHVPM